MAGWDYYVLERQEQEDPQVFLERLAKLGSQSWELVSVDGGVMYFKRYENYEAQLRTGVAAENVADAPLFDLVADSSAGQRVFSADSSMDSGPDGTEHSHAVKLVVGPEMSVVKYEVQQVNGHTHPITVVGSLDEVDGHTHTFSIESGHPGTHQY